jgi:four helix bundle protein
VQFLHNAKGSAAEVRSLVHVARDLGYLSDQQRADLLEQLSTIARQLGGFIRYLEKGPAPGPAPSPGRGVNRPPGP